MGNYARKDILTKQKKKVNKHSEAQLANSEIMQLFIFLYYILYLFIFFLIIYSLYDTGNFYIYEPRN